MTLQAACPKCGDSVELVLSPAKVVERASNPQLIGSRETHYETIDRRISWNCNNPECDQRDSYPKITKYLEEKRKLFERELEEWFKKQDFPEPPKSV